MDERHVGLIIGEDDRLIGIIPVDQKQARDLRAPDRETCAREVPESSHEPMR